MACLIDTSVLVRLADAADALHPIAARAIVRLHRRGEVLNITAQNLVEFRAVPTRPLSANGMGLAGDEAEARAADFEADFPLLAENAAIFPAWKNLVAALGIVGKQVHDARLVAVCHMHGVSQLLTFNTRHFVRLASHGPGLVILDPASV